MKSYPINVRIGLANDSGQQNCFMNAAVQALAALKCTNQAIKKTKNLLPKKLKESELNMENSEVSVSECLINCIHDINYKQAKRMRWEAKSSLYERK